MNTFSLSFSQERKKHLLYFAMLASSSLVLLFFYTVVHAATDHTELIKTYEGSKTCRACHEDAVSEVTQSIHYRLMGPVQDVYNMFTNKPVTGEHGKGDRY